MEDEVVDLQDEAMYVTMAERSIDTQHTGTGIRDGISNIIFSL